jgi:branched-chain amino acid transport system substrate-binding protein
VLDFERGRGGSDWLFRIRTSQPIFAAAQAQFAIDEFSAKNIALTYINTDFGQGAVTAQKPVIESSGATVFADLPHAGDVTDLTADILAAKGSDVVVASDFSNDLALWIKQAADNGLDVPLVGGGSTQTVVANGLVDNALLKDVYGVDDCNVGTDASTVDFAKAWQDEYGYAPSAFGALFYDGIFLAKQAIEDSQSVDPEAIRTAMESVSFAGICHNYEANAETHDLSSSVSVAKFNTDGTITAIKVIDG